MEDFRLKMLKTPLASKGCFTAHYPNASWQPANCGTAPKYPNPVARGAGPTYVGAGDDYFLKVTSGNISSATGSFDSASGVTQVFGSRFGNLTVVYPNTYSLQLNANQFATAACAGSPGCQGWQQFLFTQSQCGTVATPTPCIFMEYWLLNHGPSCPGGWTYYPGTSSTVPGCFLNTAFTDLQVPPPLTELGDLKLIGTSSGGIDTVTLSTPSGVIATNAQSSFLGLASGWTGGEYNIVGDCCSSEVYFNSGSSITVRLSADNGTTNAPNCTNPFTFNGDTAETNNLSLTSACSPTGGTSPAIVFTESGGGKLPDGISIGDTHLTKFHGLHYDFQATGDFVLVQSDPDFVVQSRQRPFTLPSVSVNTSVCTKMGDTRVEIALTGIRANGTHVNLSDGQTLSLPGGVTVLRRGNVYVVSRASGDVVQAHLMAGYMDVSVTLGVTNPSTVRGLLGGENNLITRDGKVLSHTPSWDEWSHYADSWRVGRGDEQLCEGQIMPGMPLKPMYAEDLSAQEREHARNVCVQAGVKGELLDDCVLDVSVLESASAADVFVYAPPVKMIVRPSPPPGP